jgi:uncharacterized delta-60 repeat protein
MVGDSCSTQDGWVPNSRWTVLAGALVAAAALLVAAPSASSAGTLMLDPSYGEAGVATVQVAVPDGHQWYTQAATVDPLGRALVVGRDSFGVNAQPPLSIVRLTPSGALDPSFGDDGKVVLPEELSIYDVKADATRIVLAGREYLQGEPDPNHGALVALKVDGSLDPAFGEDGIVAIEDTLSSEAAAGIALSAGGEITVGTLSGNDPQPRTNEVRRFDSSGTPVSTFGEHGIIQFGPTADVVVGSLAVDSESRTLVGRDQMSSGGKVASLVRYLPDGTIDSTFGDGGAVAAGTGWVDQVEVTATGAIVTSESDRDSAISRVRKFTPTGTPMSSFGQAGVVNLTQPVGETMSVSALTELAYDRVAVLTQAYNGNTFASSRLTILARDGSVVPSGTTIWDRPAVHGSLAVDPHGRLLTAGPTAGYTGFEVRALLPPSAPTPSPTITNVTARPGALSVTWTAPELTPTGAVRLYQLFAVRNGAVAAQRVVPSDVRQASLDGLTSGTPYDVVVLPYTATTVGTASNPVAGTPSATGAALAPATAVQNLAATPGSSFATVTWQPPVDDGGAPILGYSVIAVNHADGTLAAWRNLPADRRNASIPALTPVTAYDLYVLAYTSQGFGAVAAPVAVTPAANATQPAAPTMGWTSAVATGGNNLNVNWGPALERGQVTTTYNVVTIQNGAMTAWSTGGPDARQATVHLPSGAPAQVYVFAQSASGYGPLADPASVTP